ncbi:MAG: TonB-dependent receptor plug domain-containing protein [Rikenellaceae bacterium]
MKRVDFKKVLLSSLLVVMMSLVDLVAAEYALSGRVVDESGRALAAATVGVNGSSHIALTDEDGGYSLTLDRGLLTIVVQCMGYESSAEMVELRGDVRYDVTLKQSSYSVDQVDVHTKSETQRLKEGLFSVNSLDVAKLANTSSSLSEIVGKSAGVKIREEGGTGSDYDLSINGLSGNSVRYFIDGVPMSTMGGTLNLSNIPINIVERMEVYKGVVPSHLGADALGGAINIITKDSSHNYLDASIGAGSFHTAEATITGQYVTPTSRIIVRPTVALDYSKNDYTMYGVEVWDEQQWEYVATDLPRFHDEYRSAFVQLEAGVKDRKWADSFMISSSWSAVDKEVQTGSVQTAVYGDVEREQRAYNVMARYRKERFLTERLSLSATASHTWDRSKTIDTAFRLYSWDGSYINSGRSEIRKGNRMLRHYNQPLSVVQSNLDYKLGDWQSLNFNYQLESVGNEQYDEVDSEILPSNDHLSKHIFGLSYSQNLFGERMSNTIFVKDYMSRLRAEQQEDYWITNADDIEGGVSTNNVGFGAGTKLTISEALSFKASYESSYRLPSARELLGNGSTLYANFALKPESSDNINFGLFGTLRKARHTLFYEANLFYRDVEDYISLVISDSEDGTMQYDNISSVRIIGGEAEVRYNYGRSFEAVANMSYQDARSMTKYYANGQPQVTYKNKIPNKPWLFGNVDLNYTFFDLSKRKDELRLSYEYSYTHWYFLTWEGYGSLASKSTIPTQHQHNVEMTYSFAGRRYNLTAECQNLFNTLLYDNYMLQRPGRSFYMKFRCFIN